MMNALNRVLGLLASLRLAVICLILLFILVFWGTLYQVDNGLWAARERFFGSWVFMLGGFIPFPGGTLVLWVFCINLFMAMMLHFRYGWKKFGIVLIHAGLVLMLLGGWITRLFAQESFLTLIEGQSSNVSSDYRDWELSVWRPEQFPREVRAFDMDRPKPGAVFDYPEWGFAVNVDRYYRNSRPYVSEEVQPVKYLNSQGINMVEPAKLEKEPEANMPAGLFTVKNQAGTQHQLLLFGGDQAPVEITMDGVPYQFQLRHRRYALPVLVELTDFKKAFHPNSEIPRHFSSRIRVKSNGTEREVVVEMNKPFRIFGHTFYQASYGNPIDGRELSTFAVVRNYGRLIPYVATGVTVIGLIYHFLLQMYRPARSKNEGVI